MDFLVTGGMGFIGRATIKELIRRYPESQITCLDNLSLSEFSDLGEQVEFVQGDVRNFDLVKELVDRCKIGIVHLAADSRVLPSLAEPYLVIESTQSNVLGTANVLVAITKAKFKPSLVYAGSSTAYGEVAIPHREDKLPSIQSPYSATKLAGELLVRSFVLTFGVKATVLRYFQVYGPGQPSSGAYALVTGIFIRQFKEGAPLTIEGDGLQTRDFVHVRDVARANVLGLSFDSMGQPINIGSGKAFSIQELADMISSNQVHRPARRIDLKDTLADTSLAERLLGWKAEIDLAAGIEELKTFSQHQKV